MAGSTDPSGYPFATGPDRIRSWPGKMQELAEAVDFNLGETRRGTTVVTSMPAAGTAKTVSVTFKDRNGNNAPFPSGVIPVVVANCVTSSPTLRHAPGVSNITEAGFTLAVANVSSTTDYTAAWIATA